MSSIVITLARRITKNWVFKRYLPHSLGRLPVYVSPQSDIRVLSPFISLAQIDEELFAAARLLVRPGMTVWDLEANVGSFSLAAAYMTRDEGQVVAVEADDRHIGLCRKTLANIQGRVNNVGLLCAAISDKVGITELNIVSRGHGKNYIQESKGYREAGEAVDTKPVVTVTMD